MHLRDLIGRPEPWARILGWTTLGGLLCGLVGPFGSYDASPTNRILFWISLFWAGTLILRPSIAIALAIAGRKGFPPLFAGIGAALLACIPLSGFAAAACWLFWPVRASGILPQEWYGQTVILAFPLAAVAAWFEWYRSPAVPSHVAFEAGFPHIAEAVREPATELPERLLDLILCLNMEDHHVRYYTARGSQLHFAPMRDVVEQLGNARGLRVHRSWWIARSAVCGASGNNRTPALVLSNGLTVPVARSHMPAVRAEGWLDALDLVTDMDTGPALSRKRA